MRMLLHVTNHRIELSLQKTVGIGERQQQRLHVRAFRCRGRVVARDRTLVNATLVRKRIDPVRVEPGSRQDRSIGNVAVDEDSPEALHAAMNQRGQRPIAAEEHALVRFVLEDALVGDEELLRKEEGCLGRVQRLPAQRMRRGGEVQFEPGPENLGGVPVLVRQFEAPGAADGDGIGGGQRVADDAGRLDGGARQRLVEPGGNLCRSGFRRTDRMQVDRG